RRGDRLRHSASTFSTSSRDSSGGRRQTVGRVNSPALTSSSGATLETLLLYSSGVGVRKLFVGSVRSGGTGLSLLRRNCDSSCDCGTPTPSFQRLIELLPDTEKTISRICKSV